MLRRDFLLSNPKYLEHCVKINWPKIPIPNGLRGKTYSNPMASIFENLKKIEMFGNRKALTIQGTFGLVRVSRFSEGHFRRKFFLNCSNTSVNLVSKTQQQKTMTIGWFQSPSGYSCVHQLRHRFFWFTHPTTPP